MRAEGHEKMKLDEGAMGRRERQQIGSDEIIGAFSKTAADRSGGDLCAAGGHGAGDGGLYRCGNSVGLRLCLATGVGTRKNSRRCSRMIVSGPLLGRSALDVRRYGIF